MEIKQILALNSVIWATAMLAVAFILKGETRFLEILLVLMLWRRRLQRHHLAQRPSVALGASGASPALRADGRQGV